MKTSLLLVPLILLASCGGGESDSSTSTSGVASTTAEAGDLLDASGSQLPADQQAILDGSSDPQADRRLAALKPSRSKLVLETDDLDLGVIFQQHDVPVEVKFKVEGPDPVRIVGQGSSDGLPVSCGCTSAYIRADWAAPSGETPDQENRWDLSQEIPAGAEGTVIATFHGNRYSRVKSAEITLRGNMANGPLIIGIKADVKPVYQTKPAQVMFGKVLAGALRESDPQTEVVVVAMRDFEVLRWKHLPAGVTAEVIGEAEALKDGRVQKRFRFTLGKSAPVGQMNGSALAETSLGFDFEVLLSGQVLGPVKYRPENRLMFGFWDQGEAKTRTVRIELQLPKGTMPEPIVSFEGGIADYLSASFVPAPGARTLDIKVTSSAEMPVGSYNGVMKIVYPEDSKLPPHQLTVKAIVREKAAETAEEGGR